MFLVAGASSFDERRVRLLYALRSCPTAGGLPLDLRKIGELYDAVASGGDLSRTAVSMAPWYIQIPPVFDGFCFTALCPLLFSMAGYARRPPS